MITINQVINKIIGVSHIKIAYNQLLRLGFKIRSLDITGSRFFESDIDICRPARKQEPILAESLEAFAKAGM